MPRLFSNLNLKFSTTECPEELSNFAWKMMCAEERQSTIKNQKLIIVLIMTMVPFFSILDYFAYPEFFELFLYLRLICVATAGFLLALVYTPLGKRYYRAFTVALPLHPAFFISLMILFAQDPGTSYYAGLTLCIVAIGFVFHWTYIEAFIATVSIAIMYFLASAPALVNGMDSKTAAGFVNNCIFIAAKGTVIISGCIAHHRFRVANFVIRSRDRQQRIALRRQKAELEEALVELKDTEGRLIQSEKMASLGQLSAGVIHEIGNPLNYSNQALYLLRKLSKGNETNPQMSEAIEDIQDSIDRMKDIVRELREFSHKSSEVRIEFEIEDCILVAQRMLGKEIEDAQVVVSTHLESGLRIEGVKNQLTQVILNLVHNAIQAMAKSGKEQGGILRLSTRSEGSNVIIEVWDNGPGIEKDHAKQLFDPFFTTKEVGEGTGLGLSISYRIVESHNGSIRVESELGEFTRFVIRLPLLSQGNPSNHHSQSLPPKRAEELGASDGPAVRKEITTHSH